MKRGTLIIIFIIFSFSLFSQVKQEVIASAGGYTLNGGVSLSWTLGETVIPTYKSGDVILTHGFQQHVSVATIKKELELQVDIVVYPNPAVEVLNIRFGSSLSSEIDLALLDSNGRTIKSEIIEASVIEKQLNLQDLPGGVYYLRLTKDKLVNVYKVVKL